MGLVTPTLEDSTGGINGEFREELEMFIAVLLAMLSSTDTSPLDFRCDTLRVDSKAGQSLCTGNVVVIRGPRV